jgi:tetratricopeptide (TPR) repeat protein
MASIIPGYEYDIFISYRQKDNKYDGWVTEFIDHLKREIEATFKEDISIYFDENPHDGLLEIHNVDKSLETKLKSLIFMPVISQTYCDPKSFAWQNEFVAFNKMAASDPIGRDVKLASGNVCSRIIPVKIHDMDASDTELIENEMGCRLRSIDFIYSSAGVNRPLKPDDNPEKNLNKTFYRDQINKVANAIKEVIYGVHPDPKKRATKSYQTGTASGYTDVRATSYPEKPAGGMRLSGKTILLGSLGILLVLAIAIFLPKLIRSTKSEVSGSEVVKKAIAVLPVSNLSGNPDLDYIAEGIQDDVTGRLGAISGFNVRPKASTLQFKGSQESIQQIAKKLSVNNMVESSIKGTEEKLQIEVRLIEAFPEEKYVWSSSFVGNWNNIAETYNDIINKIVDGSNIRLTSLESKNLSIVQKHDPALYKLYTQGTYYVNRNTKEDFEKALKCFNDAMAIDPSDPLPYLGLALGYSNSGHMSPVADDAPNRAKSYAIQALGLDSTLADAHVVLATRYLYTEWNFPKAEYHLKRAIELNPSIASAHYTYGWFLTLPTAQNKMDEAIAEMKKSVEIAPTDLTCQGYLAWLYLFFGNFEEALNESRKLLQLDPNNALAYYLMGSSYAEMGMNFEAIEMNRKGLSISPGYESGLAIAYLRAGQKDKAMEVIAQMEKYQDQWWYAWGLAEVYSVLGDKDKVIKNLETAYKLHGDFVPWIQADLYFKPMSNDPRFKDIVKRLNLPD